MVLVNMPPIFIVSAVGLMIVVLNAVIGGVVLRILSAVIALVVGIMLATAIYSLFRHGI
jgi:glucan phosphoethanolaminetransferase (alkaline phosphatase superfamily)